MTTTAVIGCGDVSVVHLEAIARLAGADLVAVCDTDPGRAAAAARRYDVPAYTGHRQLLDAVRPDVVHICTPHDQHVPVALDCLGAGVAVLAEKPVAATVAEADRLIAAAGARPHVKIGICLQNRYNTSSRAAEALLRGGELGRVLGGSASVLWHRDLAYYESRPWRGQRGHSGGGVLINQAIHTLDLLDWLIGDVRDVHGRTGAGAIGPGIDVEDTAYALLDHENGARSVFFATVANATDSPVTIEIVTERAVLLIRGDLRVTYADGRTETVAEPLVSTGGRSYWGASHELLIADFYRSLTDPEPFWISPRAASRALRLIEQLYRQNP
jgi:UDP-N-acetyl-2-amino-2-deoxyglucuronate dehydrogenase